MTGPRVPSRASRWARLVLAALPTLVLASCDKVQTPEYPEAEVYVPPTPVHGQWRGEVDGVAGTLRVQDLEGSRYYGLFEAGGVGRRYVLNMERLPAAGPDGSPAPSNLVRFTWQDGRGDRGDGWLLVNRDGSALTGSFGRGDGNTSGAGDWTFMRDGETPPPSSTPPTGEPEDDDAADGELEPTPG
jgi:hypothetical protein